MEYLIVGQPGVMTRRYLQRIRRRGQGCRYYQPNKQEDFFPVPVHLGPVIKNTFNSGHQTVINS